MPGQWKAVAIWLVTVTAVALPWQLYIHGRFPVEAAWEAAYNRRHLFEALEGHANDWWYYLLKITVIYGELIYLPLAWLLVVLYNRPIRKSYLILAAWIGIPLAVFSLAATKMPGYILIAAPAFLVLTARFADYLWRPGPRKVLAVVLLLLPLRYTFERVKPFAPRYDDDAVYTKELSESLPGELATSDSLIIFNCPYPIEVMFRTGHLAYEQLPPDRTLERLRERGWRIHSVSAPR